MEFFVEDMKNLPRVVEKRLKELRHMDGASNKSLQVLNDEGNKIFDELAELAKADPNFDEAPIREKFQTLLGKRGATLSALDEQMKKITKLYDLVDGRIAFLDTCTKEVAHLFPQVPGERGMGMRKKKKKKSSAADALNLSTDEAFAEAMPMASYDPNEPLYCTCRQPSYGNMVGCENDNCEIEWFHYACVGLKSEPSADDKWYCVNCTKNM